MIRSNDYLPERYLAREELEPQITENEQELEDESNVFQEIKPDPSIYEPMSTNGMTAAKAWSAVLGQLKADMPKAAYDKWVKDALLLFAKDSTFLIGAKDHHTRDWLSSRLSSTVTRQLAGICDRSVQIRFVNFSDLNDETGKD